MANEMVICAMKDREITKHQNHIEEKFQAWMTSLEIYVEQHLLLFDETRQINIRCLYRRIKIEKWNVRRIQRFILVLPSKVILLDSLLSMELGTAWGNSSDYYLSKQFSLQVWKNLISQIRFFNYSLIWLIISSF